MKKTIFYILLLVLFILAQSCEKVIDIQVNDEIGKLVIEASINNTSSQQEIKLSRNVSFSAGNDYPSVKGAKVIVYDDEEKEYVFQETIPGTYVAKDFTGQSGRNYSMYIQVNESKFTAKSKMPQVVLLDSIIAEKPKLGDKDTRNIKVFYRDPKDDANQYRFILFVNNKQIKDVYALNDDFNNGNPVSITLRPSDDEEIYPGDQIRVEMLCIDKSIYNYWYSLMQQSSGGGIAPSNPPTNISPSVFGYFSAQTISSKSIVVN